MITADLAVRGRPAPDRQSHVRVVGLEEVRSDRVAELMTRDRGPVALGVLDRDGKPRFDVAHRLADVLPVELTPPVVEGIEQSQRQHLLDVRRRVLLGDACKLVAPARRVERGIVLLLVEVERGDVLAVLAVGKPEHDLASKTTGPRQRFVHHGGSVRRADEHDVVGGGLEGRDAQVHLAAIGADHARYEEAVKRQVDEAAALPDKESRVVDSVHQDKQHVEPELPAAHHPHHSAHRAPTLSRPALAEGIDLIDEDDAAAPDLRSLAGGADHQVDAEGVDAEEHAGERAAVRDVDRNIQRRRDRLGEHRLSGAWRADHEHAALPLAARLDEHPAVLDQVEDAAHLFDRSLLTAHVFDAHPEVGVIRVDDRLADARVDVERPEEQQEVRTQQEEEIDELGEDLRGQRG